MSFRINAFRALCSAFLVVAVSVFAFGDTIRLKDGSIIKGKITAFGGGQFTVSIGQGTRKRQLSFSVDEIESIEFDQSPRQAVVPVSDRTAEDSSDNVSSPPSYSPPASSPKVVVTDTPKKPAVTANRPAPSQRRSTTAKPVELAVKVLADETANGWTNSGWVVRKGQKIRVSASGEVSIGRGKTSTPSGLYDVEDGQKLLKNVPTAALIAVIGDDNNDFIYIGAEREFTAERDGSLFLGLNEGRLSDNSGSFDVKIQILPAGAE